MRPERSNDLWQLRPVGKDDIDGVHTLLCKPPVYRFLCDGAAPDRSAVSEEIERSIADAAEFGVGQWVLESPHARYSGCVQLRPDRSSKTAELSYFLDPEYWRRGLATRMGWTAITLAFRSPLIDYVFAGADLPNEASFEVMRRLGMRFRRKVQYPLGEGKEYGLHRDAQGPNPRPALLRLHG